MTIAANRRLIFSAMVVAGGVSLLMGCPYWYRLLGNVAMGKVESCVSHYSHGWISRYKLSTGATIDLSFEDVQKPELCLPVGTMIEKRFGEPAYRVNGIVWVSDVRITMRWLGYWGGGLFLVGIGGLIRIWRRSRVSLKISSEDNRGAGG